MNLNGLYVIQAYYRKFQYQADGARHIISV